MADGDQRVEVLEDEMKVLKGEVSRTLVDLRALLMREDSPLMAGGLVKRIQAPPEAVSGTSQVTMTAAAGDPPPTVVAIDAAAALEQATPALAALPGLGGIEMPTPPGAAGDAVVPSQADAISLPPTAVAMDPAPPPSVPTAGDFGSAATAPEPAAMPDSGMDAAREENLARERKARLLKDEQQDEEQRGLRARRREQDQAEDEADQERRNRKRQQESQVEQEDQERRERRKKQERGEDEERESRNRRRQQEDEEGASEQERRDRTSQREREDEEEHERRERRKQRDQEEDEERVRQRERNREEEEERERQRAKNQEEDEAREQHTPPDQDEEDVEPETQPASTKLESNEEGFGQQRRDRRKRQNREEDEELERRVRRRLNEDDDRQDIRNDRFESEMEAELDRVRRVRRRGEALEEEMERPSPSHRSEDDWETEGDAENSMDSFDEESGYDSVPKSLDAHGADPNDTDFGWQAPDDSGDDYAPGNRADRESDYDHDYDPETRWDDDLGDGSTAGYDNDYAHDRDEEMGYQAASGSKGNFDSHEYQEEPKINGNNGSRRSRRSDEGRRGDEDSYYEYPEGRDDRQDYGRGPQNPPRTQRMSRPPADGRGEPRGRGPAPDDYGYAPNGGNGQWGQPPAGYGRWPAPQDWAPEPSPMDLNLVSSLVRWASLAKHKVGEKRLSDIIELYVESRSATGGLKEALTHIASIVDDQQPESNQPAQETMDLIAHLHGILTAALPVPEVPKINSQINFIAANRNPNGNSNGDW